MRSTRTAHNIGIWLIALSMSPAVLAHDSDDRSDAAERGSRCEAEKVKEASRYHACLMKARFRAIIFGRNPERAVARCDAKFGAKWPKIERRGGELCPSTDDEKLIQSLLAEQIGDVTTLLSGGTLPPAQALLATGQTTCRDSSGSVIACGATGQDGDIQAGAPLAYQDNGDGTITDLNTGLTWEKLSDDGSIHDRRNSYSWEEAFEGKIAALNGGAGFAGHRDWRVPNRRELDSIVNLDTRPAVSPAFNTGCMSGCTVLTCSCTVPSFYWSSSSLEAIPGFAWIVRFDNGDVFGIAKRFRHNVRAVRGP